MSASEMDNYLKNVDEVIEELAQKMGSIRNADNDVELLRENCSKRFKRLCAIMRKEDDDEKTNAIAAKISDERTGINKLAQQKIATVKAAYKVRTRFRCCVNCVNYNKCCSPPHHF